MQRESLLGILKAYKKALSPILSRESQLYGHDEGREQQVCAQFLEFVASEPKCLDSDHYFANASRQAAHLTGSALVVDPDFSRVVLTHHRKLGKWLQLGGHSDNEPQLEQVALREAHEESGLKDLSLYCPFRGRETSAPLPFDLDIHRIPSSMNREQHQHYDLRFIVIARDEELTISPESLDLRWFSLEQAQALCDEESMQRQFNKLRILRHRRMAGN